jgi:hypothetical protein
MANNKFYFERDIVKSGVFRSLSKTAIFVYLDFRLKCKWQPMKVKEGKNRWGIINNGEIEYTYSEAEKKGISRSSFMRSLDELIKKGFIDVAHSGSGGAKGDKSKYVISERWRKYDTPDFIEASRPKDMRTGRGFRTGNEHWKKRIIGVKNGNPPIAKNGNPSII